MDRKVENTQQVACLVTEERNLRECENVFVFKELEEDDYLEIQV